MSFIQSMSFLLAQTETDTGESLFDTIQKGGLVGYLIIGLSIVALVLVVMHVVQIRRGGLLPPEQLDEIDRYLARGDVGNALAYSADPENDSYLTRILTVGLTRYQKSAFGAFEIKSAIEEAGEEQTARLYRSTDALGVIGAIAPLLGLLGTVVGMVGAFSTLEQSSVVKPEALAGDISLALVTTLMGLILAIPTIALFTFFRNRIDSFAAEAGREIEKMILHLESISNTGPGVQRPAGAPQPARGVARPAAKPAPPGQTGLGSSGGPGGTTG